MSSSTSPKRPLRVGFLGFGTVGEGTFRMLADNADEIRRKVHNEIEVVKVAVRDPNKRRSVPAEKITFDAYEVVRDPSIDIVLELMGGEEPAYDLVKTALENGKHVVTANKELMAKRGSKLVRLAREKGLDLHFEAAVGGEHHGSRREPSAAARARSSVCRQDR